MIDYLMTGGITCLWALVFMLILMLMCKHTNFITIYITVVYVIMTIIALTYLEYGGC